MASDGLVARKSGAWARDYRSGVAPMADEADTITNFFELQLKSLGFTHVASLHRVMKNSKNAPLYRLVFASHSPRGLDFWKKISEIGHDGQRRLF